MIMVHNVENYEELMTELCSKLHSVDERSADQLAADMVSMIDFLNGTVGEDHMVALTHYHTMQSLQLTVLFACLMHPSSPRRAGLYLWGALTETFRTMHTVVH